MRAPAALLLLLLAGCGGAGESGRTVENTELRVRFEVPKGWLYIGDEVRSPSQSLISVQVHSLEGAERRFVAGLPDSLLPQLEGWTRYYYVIAGEPVRSEAAIGSEKAFEITWPVRIRPADPLTRVTYWVVRREDRLYVVRAAYAPGAAGEDEPAVRALLASWSFF